MAELIKPDIFNHTDYLIYLNDLYTANRHTGSAADFFGWIAREGGFTTATFVSDLFNGTEPVSVKSCIQISKALAHSSEEADYFRCLVGLSQADHEQERQMFKKLRKEIAERNGVRTEMVDRSRQEFYAQWYHSAIRVLIGMYENSGDLHEQCAEKLLLPVTRQQIDQSVDLLSRLGFIRKNRNGTFRIATAKNIKTGRDYSREEKRLLHLQYLKLAGDILSERLSGPDKVSSHVIGISGKSFEQICRYTDELKKRMNTLVENEEKPDRVYLYQLLFVPLTKESPAE